MSSVYQVYGLCMFIYAVPAVLMADVSLQHTQEFEKKLMHASLLPIMTHDHMHMNCTRAHTCYKNMHKYVYVYVYIDALATYTEV